MAQTPKSNGTAPTKPEMIVKEICCCNFDKKDKLGDSSGICQQAKEANDSKMGQTKQSDSHQSKLSKQKASERILWKHILMKVKQRKRFENGQMGNVVQAINMISGEKCVLMVDPKLLDDQDIPGLERVLKDRV
jgi:hypothetical protein